jgi:putative acetyltransferase
MKIRLYEPKYLEEIVQLWYKTWNQTFTDIQHPQPYSAWKERFCNDLAIRGEVWVAELENHIVGFIVVIKAEEELNQIFVDPMYQNKGVGSALINKAKEISPKRLKLYTLQQNQRACLFYEKHGFKAGNVSVNKYNRQPNVEYNWVYDKLK